MLLSNQSSHFRHPFVALQTRNFTGQEATILDSTSFFTTHVAKVNVSARQLLKTLSLSVSPWSVPSSIFWWVTKFFWIFFFLWRQIMKIKDKQPSTQAFSSRSLDLARNFVTSPNGIPREHTRAIRRRQYISRQVEWAGRECLGTRLKDKYLTRNINDCVVFWNLALLSEQLRFFISRRLLGDF